MLLYQTGKNVGMNFIFCILLFQNFIYFLGEFLQLNFENTYKCNKIALSKDAKTFGIAWLGDGATIKRMPLLNMLELYREEPPVVISIFDFSDMS